PWRREGLALPRNCSGWSFDAKVGRAGTQRIVTATRSTHRTAPPGVEKTFSDVLLRELADILDCGLLQFACMSGRRDPHTNRRFAPERPIWMYQPKFRT